MSERIFGPEFGLPVRTEVQRDMATGDTVVRREQDHYKVGLDWRKSSWVTGIANTINLLAAGAAIGYGHLHNESPQNSSVPQANLHAIFPAEPQQLNGRNVAFDQVAGGYSSHAISGEQHEAEKNPTGVNFDGVGGGATFIGHGTHGDWHFEPHLSSLVHPFQLEVRDDQEKELTANYAIPQRYARSFETAQQVHDHDLQQKLMTSLNGDISKHFLQRSYGVGVDPNGQMFFHTGQTESPIGQYQIDSIQFEGHASGEGPQEAGAKPLTQPDPENVNLANLRGEEAKQVSVSFIKANPQFAQSLGITQEEFIQEFEHAKVEGTEINYSTAEIQELGGLGRMLGINGADESVAHALIIAYNAGKLHSLPNFHLFSKREQEINTMDGT